MINVKTQGHIYIPGKNRFASRAQKKTASLPSAALYIRSERESNYKATGLITSVKTPNYDNIVDSLNIVVCALKDSVTEKEYIVN